MQKREMKGGDLELPAGFRFHPTDEELVMHYLCRKCASLSIAVPIIAEIDLYKHDPWQLPGMALYGEKEWYFFSHRDRKYPNGSRPNRTAGTGYWKATGADKPIGKPKAVGIKKALVFYAGKAPKGVKTDWIMHEYRLADVDRSARKKNGSLKLDDWVLCRIYNKKGDKWRNFDVDMKPTQSIRSLVNEDSKPEFLTQNRTMMPPPPPVMSPAMNEFLYLNSSDSIPLLHTDSSCSEHVVSSEFTCEKEVQSQPRWLDWERTLDIPINNFNAIASNPPQFDDSLLSPLSETLMYLHKPF